MQHESSFSTSESQNPSCVTVSTIISVLSGFIEASGTAPITELMDLIDSSKSANSNANLIRYHDLLLDRAVNTLGRVLA